MELAARLVTRLGIQGTNAMAALAYRFNITDPRITTTVAGFSELSHLHGAIDGLRKVALSADEMQAIMGAWHELFALEPA